LMLEDLRFVNPNLNDPIATVYLRRAAAVSTMEQFFASYTRYLNAGAYVIPFTKEHDVRKGCVTFRPPDAWWSGGAVSSGNAVRARRGTYSVRVPVSWPMDRPCDKAFVDFEHIACPFCIEHAVTRMCESITGNVQALAIQENTILNMQSNMKAAKMQWRPAEVKDTGAWRLPQMDGGAARLIADSMQESLDMDDGACAWLHDVLEDEGQRKAIRSQYVQLCTINKLGRIKKPLSDEEVLKFNSACRRLVWEVNCFWPPSMCGALYYHTVYAHGPEYMKEYRTLGKFSQSSLEKNNKNTNKTVEMSTRAGGKKIKVQNSDGTTVMMRSTGPLVVMKKAIRLLASERYSTHYDAEFLKTNKQAMDVDTTWKQKRSVEIAAALMSVDEPRPRKGHKKGPRGKPTKPLGPAKKGAVSKKKAKP
jgi:hypothetical protein